MSSNGRIEDEETYENTLAWMVDKAKKLNKPLSMSDAERAKLQRTYDFVEQRIREYNRGQMVLSDPGRRKIYEAAGAVIQEFPQQKR